MKTSTRKPTAAESAYINACKEGPCVACVAWQRSGKAPFDFRPWVGCDFHHMKSGNVRRGHMYGVGLCGWHHRQLLDWGSDHAEMREFYGPSLMDGSRLFHEIYGSDDALLQLQHELLGKEREVA